MIVTKNWLNEWIDLSAVSTQQLLKTFNAIGLEVDRHDVINVPQGVVIGFVESCEKHPDADKLNVCQVNVGTDVRQIVCGASNVRAGIYVAVATVGAQLPGGLIIKEAKLRGMDSYGMICSSKEIGLPSMGEGIMILDASIGLLESGKELSAYPIFNDDIIEIELTANRGDCLSIHGVARDLSAAFNKELRESTQKLEQEGRLGIGRILQLQHAETYDVELLFGAVEIKELSVPFLITLRMAILEENSLSIMDTLLKYATHSTGVVLRAYPFGMLEETGTGKSVMTLSHDENGYAALYGKEKLSIVGVSQREEGRFLANSGLAIIEASYISPDIIAKKMGETKVVSCPHYYHTSRGSEPELEMGIRYVMRLFEKYTQSAIYGGNLEVQSSSETRVVTMDEGEFESFIGMKIDKTTLTQILKNLGMGISKPKASTFAISVPRFRHDILNKQDIIEEIVRMVGIDNIPSKALVFTEKNQNTDDLETYRKIRTFRQRCAQSGFFESVHFVFNERSLCERFGFECTQKEMELLNPITATFDTLRPTLMLGLLNSASANGKVNQKKIALFESGMVFDTNRIESKRLAFIISGGSMGEKLSNAGKAPVIDLATFAQRISDIIGSFEMSAYTPIHTLAHPYMCARIIINGAEAGELFRVHPSIEAEFDLSPTFMCEVKMDALPYGLVQAQPFSKFQASFRDLSLLVPKSLQYEEIKAIIVKHASVEIQRFYPVDRYVSDALGDNVSLSIRFVVQSMEKTLEEEEITVAMESILKGLNEELGVGLR
ncbi:MAG: phenylalanine--tRNA ligase subunit beta [Campylobacterales bacterium]|nr:phenylalanine--tRNA ligase subunit beta [Campylobacterales bacterium]